MVYVPNERPEFPRHVPADTSEEFRFSIDVDPINERRDDAAKRVKAVMESEFERFADDLWGTKKEDG